MRTKTLQAVAVTLGLGVCTVAQAQDSYTSPSKWNNFRTVSDKNEVVPTPETALPTPSADPSGALESGLSTPMIDGTANSSAAIGSGQVSSTYSSPYSQAMSAPWPEAPGAGACGDACGAPARPPLSACFGYADLLFYTMETDRGSALAYDGTNTTNIWSSAVDPDASVGFDVMAGRYFNCGQFGFGIGYMLWDPGSETIVYNGIGAGTLRANRVEYNDVTVDAGGGAEAVYTIIDGSGGYAGAEAIRLNRDLRFQGIEANLFSFGLMGARRAAYNECDPCRKGFGGAAGPLARACNGRVRMMTSHGFRWLRIDDDFETAYNVDGVAGYAADDIYHNYDVENNLYGYQFGGMLTYCLGCRTILNIGGKVGIYGNDVEVRQRLGTQTNVAQTAAADDLNVTGSDTVLATIGELDLGLGFRITNAWSVRGGYRLMGITGVVDAVEGLQNTNLQNVVAASEVYADDSYILHGGYVGLTYNW